MEQVRQAVKLAQSHGIQTGMFLMWGYEGEELDDIEATIRHVSVSKPDVFFTTVSYPIKGTPYYKKISDRLVQLGPWSSTSDRELRIKGRHTRQFYSHVDKLLRDEVAKARLLDEPLREESEALMTLDHSIREAREAMKSTYAEVEQ